MIKRKALVVSLITGVVLAAAVAAADSNSYTPPPERGDIYIVIRYRQGGMGGMYPQRTRVAVSWGRWNKSDSVIPPQIPPNRAFGAKGFVLKVRHTKIDSFPLTVETDGRIEQGLYQGEAPSQWRESGYARLEW